MSFMTRHLPEKLSHEGRSVLVGRRLMFGARRDWPDNFFGIGAVSARHLRAERADRGSRPVFGSERERFPALHLAAAAPQLHRLELAPAGALRDGRCIARRLELAEMIDVPAEAVEEVEPVISHRKQPRFWTLTSEGVGFIRVGM